MRSIRKEPEPGDLRAHRATLGATYGNLTPEAKQSLREALVREQGHLCAYCMQRIEPTEAGMKIEHWSPQSEDSESQIDFRNLLGVCSGGMGRAQKHQHCDTSKANQGLWSHPADPGRNPEPSLRYLADGTMRALDERVSQDIEVLNLNESAILTPNRRGAFSGFSEWLRRKGETKPGSWSRQTIERLLRELVTPDASGKLRPFVGVGEHLLRKKLR